MNNIIENEGLISIMRGVPLEKALKVAYALYHGGVRVIEVAFNPTDSETIKKTTDIIKAITQEFGKELFVGAGTVIKTEYTVAAFNAGAKFIFAPNTDVEIIKLTKQLGMLSLPGAYTPSECMQALNAGADIIKLFPITVNDIGYVVNISRPLSHMKFICVGGVNEETITKFLEAGAVGVGTGISILRPDLIKDENYAEITRLARNHVEIIRNFKNK